MKLHKIFPFFILLFIGVLFSSFSDKGFIEKDRYLIFEESRNINVEDWELYEHVARVRLSYGDKILNPPNFEILIPGNLKGVEAINSMEFGFFFGGGEIVYLRFKELDENEIRNQERTVSSIERGVVQEYIRKRVSIPGIAEKRNIVKFKRTNLLMEEEGVEILYINIKKSHVSSYLRSMDFFKITQPISWSNAQ